MGGKKTQDMAFNRRSSNSFVEDAGNGGRAFPKLGGKHLHKEI